MFVSGMAPETKGRSQGPLFLVDRFGSNVVVLLEEDKERQEAKYIPHDLRSAVKGGGAIVVEEVFLKRHGYCSNRGHTTVDKGCVQRRGGVCSPWFWWNLQ